MNRADVAVVVTAAETIGEISRRDQRWTHLPLCVLDAVYSIGARYEGTARTVRDYARWCQLPHMLDAAENVAAGDHANDEQPIGELLDRIENLGPDAFADTLRNRQRTSPRGGILKAEAARRFATILHTHGIERLADVPPLLDDPAQVATVEAELARVPGHGAHGIRVAYLWMLAGDDQHVKPDRMVTSWLTRALNRSVPTHQATNLVVAAANDLGVTPWELDHAIWNAERSRRRRR